ncbi:MAG: acyltransferase [Rhodoferax sp.]|nr:acyltransferase [Rhodoferax sp.]
MRALAVLPVVLFHVQPQWMPGGFLGVDVFFVISGYLISLILYRELAAGTFSIAGFYRRRVRRLFPALVLVMLTSLVFGFFALTADEYRSLGHQAVAAIFFVLNLRLLGEAGYFDVVSYSKPLMHLWSLSVEEQFYLVWPLLLLMLSRLRVSKGWSLVVLGLASLGFAAWLSNRHPDAAYYHPLTRFWELLIGAAVARLHFVTGETALPGKLRLPLPRAMLSFVGFLLIATAMLFFGHDLAHPGLATVWPLAGAALLLCAGPQGLANRWLSWRPLVWVGLISYPLYLWHWPMLSYVRIMDSGSPQASVLWMAAGLSVVAAWLTYRFVELPLRHSARRSQGLRGLLAAMGLLALVSTAIAAGNGFPGRPALDATRGLEKELVRTPAQDPSCVGLFPPGAAPVYCRQSSPGDKMVALVGDSHAHVLFPGVAELAAKRGLGTLLLANSGCPPFQGAVMGRTSAERQQCAKSIDKIVDAVLADRRVVSVVLASRGPQYLDGTGFGPIEANYNYPPITTEPPQTGPTAQSPSEIFAQGLLNTANRFRDRGLSVSYVLQVPELGVPAKDCLGRPLTLGARGNLCSVRYDVYQQRMQAYRSLMQTLASHHPYLHLIDLEPVFCNRSYCGGMHGQQLLYADDNHLSVSGSQAVAPLILQQALPKAGSQ